MSHLIDCHVLELPRFNKAWVAELRADLDAQPVNQHWLPGTEGQLGSSRARGFLMGNAPFVTSADPDDRILPGIYAALLQSLHENPTAPFAWAGEKLVNQDLKDLPIRVNVWTDGYHPVSHACRATHVHGVKLYRREAVTPHLVDMDVVGQACEFYLDLAIVRPWTNPPTTKWPVHVPMVGRLWRQHDHNGSRQFTKRHFDYAAQMLGFASMENMQAETAKNSVVAA